MRPGAQVSEEQEEEEGEDHPGRLSVASRCSGDRRVARPSSLKMQSGTFFPFEEHYAMARTYVQEVVLNQINIPTIDGFGCPTFEQDPEQNSLLKSILFSPWACKDPMQCGSTCVYSGLLRQGPRRPAQNGSASQRAAQSVHGSGGGGASQPATGGGARQPVDGKYTFQRGWRLRCSEIGVLAARADRRCHAARKKLVLADVTLFSESKEPHGEIEHSKEIMSALGDWCRTATRRRLSSYALRLIMELLGVVCDQHPEQCTLAEFSAYVVRDVVSHVELAAEARTKKPKPRPEDSASESGSDVDGERRERPPVELEDMGGGLDEEHPGLDTEPGLTEVSSFPLTDASKVMSLCFQEEDLANLAHKTRKSQSDVDMQSLEATYSAMLKHDFANTAGTNETKVRGFGHDSFKVRLALQKKNIQLAKKLQNEGAAAEDDGGAFQAAEGDPEHDSGAFQPAVPEIVPLEMAMQGPKVVALDLVDKAKCTEEQTDAVALLTLSLQRRFDERPDKTTFKLPVATPDNNHRAIWLGGGGCGKTRTLEKVVEPLAEVYFGTLGYSAAASSNAAAQNLGDRGRTLHNANGLLFGDSLQTARLRLNEKTTKKMDRLAGDLGVDVIDELGTVQAEMLHADALRKTYGRARRHNLDPTLYMKPQETWGRMPVKLLSGDFYQLPPVPNSASLLASSQKQSYEHMQGRKLLLDVPYVMDFVDMKRFDDPDLLHILHAMRTRGGKKIDDRIWERLQATVCKTGDPRLRDARGWWECAYEWRRVSFAMHAHARMNAKHARRVLFYIPAIDRPAVRLTQKDYDDMRACPNIGETAKLAGILPVYVGMEMVLTESYLPPRLVRGTPVEVVDIELHPAEPQLANRPSLLHDSCVVLKYMPAAIHVRVQSWSQNFLQDTASAPEPGTPDLTGVLTVVPVDRHWSFKVGKKPPSVSVTRTQIPLLPMKQSTLHGVQGKTADPGFIAHWQFPAGLTAQTKWLAYYVSLSRPRGLDKLLCHGYPDRQIIEQGPPEEITAAFDEFFSDKIPPTARACAAARAALGWPPRPT